MDRIVMSEKTSITTEHIVNLILMGMKMEDLILKDDVRCPVCFMDHAKKGHSPNCLVGYFTDCLDKISEELTLNDWEANAECCRIWVVSKYNKIGRCGLCGEVPTLIHE